MSADVRECPQWVYSVEKVAVPTFERRSRRVPSYFFSSGTNSPRLKGWSREVVEDHSTFAHAQSAGLRKPDFFNRIGGKLTLRR